MGATCTPLPDADAVVLRWLLNAFTRRNAVSVSMVKFVDLNCARRRGGVDADVDNALNGDVSNVDQNPGKNTR